jgi:hypothetical protein
VAHRNCDKNQAETLFNDDSVEGNAPMTSNPDGRVSEGEEAGQPGAVPAVESLPLEQPAEAERADGNLQTAAQEAAKAALDRAARYLAGPTAYCA